MAGRKHNGMTAKQPQDTRGKGFNPEHSQPDNCERPSATTATTDSPELTAAEAATTLASQTLEGILLHSPPHSLNLLPQSLHTPFHSPPQSCTRNPTSKI
jgi:hypothetical protein